MHAGALRALEFDRIVSVVSGLAVTPTGRDRLAELTPSLRQTARRLGLVSRPQMVRALVHAVEQPVSGVRVIDVADIRKVTLT